MVDSPHIVLCGVSKEKLNQLMAKLEDRCISFRYFKEPDIGNEITAFATRPLQGKERKLFSNLKLLTVE